MPALAFGAPFWSAWLVWWLANELGIVQEHGGRITVESQVKPPDPDGSSGGSTFSVWLPVKE